MGWQDGMQFSRWWAQTFPDRPFDEHDEQDQAIRRAYEQGYEDGFRSGRSFDPRWDRD